MGLILECKLRRHVNNIRHNDIELKQTLPASGVTLPAASSLELPPPSPHRTILFQAARPMGGAGWAGPAPLQACLGHLAAAPRKLSENMFYFASRFAVPAPNKGSIVPGGSGNPKKAASPVASPAVAATAAAATAAKFGNLAKPPAPPHERV